MHRRRFVAALTLLTASACGGSDTGLAVGPGDSSGTFAAIAGTYTLRTVGGAAPPTIVEQTGSTTVEILAESIRLEANGTWTMTTVRRTTTAAPSQPGGVTTSTLNVSDGGTFTRSGTAVTLTSAASGIAVSGTVANGRLTTTRFNTSLIYAM